MNSMPYFSVIVPMHNAAPYIGICVDSVLVQTFQDFEIIVVDDASTDNSGEICRELYGANEKVRIIRHEQNQGLGPARNTGIANARGKYILFVDADDLIIPQTLETALNVTEKIEVDVIHAVGYYELNNGQATLFNSNYSTGILGESIIQRVNGFLSNPNIRDSIYSKIYRREFLTDNEIEFPANCLHYEKTMFNLATICLAKKYLLVQGAFYVRGNNIKSAKIYFSTAIKILSVVMRYMENIFSKIPEFAENPLNKEQFISTIFEEILNKYIRPSYINKSVDSKLNQLVHENFLPIFGENTTLAKHLFHSANILYSKAEKFLLQNEALKKQIEPLVNFYAQNDFDGLCRKDYNFFYDLSEALPRNVYDELLDKVFKATVEKIRRKDKIKLAFVTENAATWCGDKLYNYFAENSRFDTKVFLCFKGNINSASGRDFFRSVEQFKSRGINVVALESDDAPVEKQDIIIFLRPYLWAFPKLLDMSGLTAETLLVEIPYGFFGLEDWDMSNLPLHHVLWKFFFETKEHMALEENNCSVKIHGYYSGYPRLDGLIENEKFNYDWKMTRPDAVKIIYAPHWTIDNLSIKFSTFRYNHKFFYEYAKAHPEISWVIKPHPNLFQYSAISGLFPTGEAFEEYLQAWDELPNAKVATGGYYHDIFATSDGMIQDSVSFIGEYQYTHKPMIFLTRDTQDFIDFGKAIMNVTYRVDGKDLNGIAQMIQKIFIEKNDPLYDARHKFFDEHFNYLKVNGMTASEYIYKNILQEVL